MDSRVILYLITSLLLGCAGDLDDQTKKQDLNEDESVDSNGSAQVTPQVAKKGLESLQAANPKLMPKSEALISPEVRPLYNEPKISPVEDEVLVADPVSVVEKLAEFELSPSASPQPAEKKIDLFYPSPNSESSSRDSGKSARLHRGMPALNLSYLK